MSVRTERKYALIRYLNAGYSLEDAKRKTIVVATASTNEYMNAKDKRDLLSLEGGLHKLTMTRAHAQEKLRVKFAPRPGYGNIAHLDVLPAQGINVYDILRRDKLVLTKAAVSSLEERF